AIAVQSDLEEERLFLGWDHVDEAAIFNGSRFTVQIAVLDLEGAEERLELRWRQVLEKLLAAQRGQVLALVIFVGLDQGLHDLFHVRLRLFDRLGFPGRVLLPGRLGSSVSNQWCSDKECQDQPLSHRNRPQVTEK